MPTTPTIFRSSNSTLVLIPSKQLVHNGLTNASTLVIDRTCSIALSNNLKDLYTFSYTVCIQHRHFLQPDNASNLWGLYMESNIVELHCYHVIYTLN
jgi:hypothetical protein